MATGVGVEGGTLAVPELRAAVEVEVTVLPEMLAVPVAVEGRVVVLAAVLLDPRTCP
jgi:hypothetical protein